MEGGTTDPELCRACTAARQGDASALQDIDPAVLAEKDSANRTPAHYAAQAGHVDALQCLHQRAPHTISQYMEALDDGGSTPAHYAASSGQTQALRCLHQLHEGILDIANNAGWTPCHEAAVRGHLSALRCLRELAPSTLQVRDNGSCTPLLFATQSGHSEAANYLQLCSTCTPLMGAVADRKPKDVEKLLHGGARLSASIGHAGAAGSSSMEPILETVTLTSLILAENNHPDFGWSLPACQQTIKLLREAATWCPKSHRLFGPSFRRGVEHIFGLKIAMEQSTQLPVLPNVAWLLVVSALPREWGFGSNSDLESDDSESEGSDMASSNNPFAALGGDESSDTDESE